MYGVEEAGLIGENDGVEAPHCTFSLEDDDHYALLQQSVNPLSNGGNYGIELYERTLEFISRTIRQNPTASDTFLPFLFCHSVSFHPFISHSIIHSLSDDHRRPKATRIILN